MCEKFSFFSKCGNLKVTRYDMDGSGWLGNWSKWVWVRHHRHNMLSGFVFFLYLVNIGSYLLVYFGSLFLRPSDHHHEKSLAKSSYWNHCWNHHHQLPTRLAFYQAVSNLGHH
ncbi:hypothetical protein R6Q59_002310 [Mikania micrantha]